VAMVLHDFKKLRRSSSMVSVKLGKLGGMISKEILLIFVFYYMELL
jgi:hypothetical protein